MSSTGFRPATLIFFVAAFLCQGCASQQKERSTGENIKRYRYDVIGKTDIGDHEHERVIREDLGRVGIPVDFVGGLFRGIYVPGGSGQRALEVLMGDARLKGKGVTLFKEIYHEGEMR